MPNLIRKETLTGKACCTRTTPISRILYLLILVDYSKRVFPFLVKSQDEWFEVWRNFVAQMEAEFGSTTTISRLVTDFGTYFDSNYDFFLPTKGDPTTICCSRSPMDGRHSWADPQDYWGDVPDDSDPLRAPKINVGILNTPCCRGY